MTSDEVLDSLKRCLIERKQQLLGFEQKAKGRARDAMSNQIQVVDFILMFLVSKQGEEDMGKLQISLDEQARPIAEIRHRRQNDGELTELLQAFAEKVKPGTGKRIILPPEIKAKSIVAKIYSLRKTNKLPAAILPSNTKEGVFLNRLTDDELRAFEKSQTNNKK